MIVKNFILAALLLTAIILTGCKEKKPPQEQYKPDARYADTVKKVDPNEVKIAHPVNDMSHPTENSNTRIPIPRPVRRPIGYVTHEIEISVSSGDESTASKTIFLEKQPIYAPHHRSTRSHAPKFEPPHPKPPFSSRHFRTPPQHRLHHPKPSFASNYFRKPPEHRSPHSLYGSFYRPKWRQMQDNNSKPHDFRKLKNKNSVSKYKGK